mmetsp:Transcript_29842/g.92268  ORF Transcript_29842/g.92268 Transcript_29842/m.92268 type:complete len:89 (+) Transcript_29842:1443-1709(+)
MIRVKLISIGHCADRATNAAQALSALISDDVHHTWYHALRTQYLDKFPKPDVLSHKEPRRCANNSAWGPEVWLLHNLRGARRQGRLSD